MDDLSELWKKLQNDIVTEAEEYAQINPAKKMSTAIAEIKNIIIRGTSHVMPTLYQKMMEMNSPIMQKLNSIEEKFNHENTSNNNNNTTTYAEATQRIVIATAKRSEAISKIDQIAAKEFLPNLNMRKTSKGISLIVPADSNMDDIAEKLNDYGLDTEQSVIHKLRPRFRIAPVPTDISDEELINNLKERNASLTKVDMKVVTRIPYFDKHRQKRNDLSCVIIETRSDIQHNNFPAWSSDCRVNVNYRFRSSMYEHLRVTTCFKCQKFGHMSSQCRSIVNHCGKCGKEHDTRECKEEVFSCTRCQSKKNKCDHPAFDRTCPEYLAEIEKLRRRTSYSSVGPFLERKEPENGRKRQNSGLNGTPPFALNKQKSSKTN